VREEEKGRKEKWE